MPARPRVLLQALAAVGLAVLLGVLVWRVVDRSGAAALPRRIDNAKPVRAPDFTLSRIGAEGKLSLSQLRGKGVVVNFWASWCGPCKEEVPLLERAWRAHRDDGLVVLGIDVNDARGDAEAFARRLGVTYPLVYDGRGKTIRPFALTSLPETLFVDRRGRVVGQRIQGGITSGDNRRVFERGIRLVLRTNA